MQAQELLSRNFGIFDIGVAAAFVLMLIGISYFLKLSLHKDLAVGSLRAVLQLIFIGYTLKYVFAIESLLGNVIVFLIMTLIAAQAVLGRLVSRSLKTYSLIVLTLIATIWPIGWITIALLFGPSSFSNSSFVIPFLGVLLGNALAAVSLSFGSVEKMYRDQGHEILTWQALGARSFEPVRRLYIESLRTSMTPILNGLAIVGVVSLPGVMAGQLMAGVDPLVAARFQIVIMFLMTFASMVATMVSVLIQHRYLNPYRTKHNDFSRLQLLSRERIVLQGPSGSGKSRWLRSLVGLSNEDYSRELLLDSAIKQRLTPDSTEAIYPVIYLQQKPFFFAGTVRKNLEYPFTFDCHRSRFLDWNRVRVILERLALSPTLLDSPAQNLSGGEAQVFHLIRAMLLEPSALFLDEPTSALDPLRAQEVELIICEWIDADSIRAVLMITHDGRQAERFASEVWELESDGKLHVRSRVSKRDSSKSALIATSQNDRSNV